MRKKYNKHDKNRSDIVRNSKVKENIDTYNRINFKSIYDLYKINFIDNCELIVREKQNYFLDKFFNKMKLIIKSEYDDNIFEKNKIIYEMTKKCENDFISDIYWPMYDACVNGYEKYKSSKKSYSFYISNFLSHCNYEQIAIHSCGSKLIQIKGGPNSEIYAFCTGCQKCYYGCCIPLYCPFSHSNYYSKILKDEEKDLVPATWDEYHCSNPITNEQMACIRCGDNFWIKNNKLFCKKCKLEVDPLLIIWTCQICNKDFKSNAKRYNPLENKESEIAIKEARILKEIARPNEIPCGCINTNDINKYNFCHKPNGQCKGILYYGKLKDENILVCSKCNSIFCIKNFCWICPVCGKKFLTDNINKKINNNNNDDAMDLSTQFKSERKNKSSSSMNLSENLEKKHLYFNYKGTPLRELNSYVKKKPNDYYNYSSKHRDRFINNSESKKRHLSTTFTNKRIDNNNDKINYETNIKKDSDNNITENKYLTNSNNNYFKNKYGNYITKYNNIENNDNLNSINKSLVKNNLFTPAKKIEKIILPKYTKIQLTTNTLKKYYNINDPKKYCPSTTRNNIYSNDINNDNSITDSKKERIMINNTSYKKKYQKYSRYNKLSSLKQNIFNFIKNSNNSNNDLINTSQVYIPKKKLDLNISNNNILSSPKITIGDMNYKRTSNSVELRERHKRSNNNIYAKRNLKTKIEAYDDNENYNISNDNNNIIDNYKEIRSSSQYKNDRDIEQYNNSNLDMSSDKKSCGNDSSIVKNKGNDSFNLKHKYNKRNIGNKYNPNYNFSNININKGITRNVFNRNMNNLYNKDKSATNVTNLSNVSNGGDNIIVNNIITNNNYIVKEYNSTKSVNDNNNTRANRKEKKYNIYNNNLNKGTKDSNSNDEILNEIYKTNNNNNNLIVNNSFKNGKNRVKDYDNEKSYKSRSSKVNESIDSSQNDELKHFNFHDYKIITQLGQGTFGIIYLVQDKNNQLFTMKKIILAEELDVQSVLNEYKMCQKIKHPNVVKILGIYSNKLDVTTYVVYVLMEVGLTDWEKEIRAYKEKKLEYSEKDLVQIIKQLSSVLSFLQKNNISHRDIKPQNILVFKNGVYKLADFGEAKKIDNKLTNLINNSLRGTELYMSPLLFNGLRTGQIDIKHNLFKSDVYSLGLCVLYAAVTSNAALSEIRKYVEMIRVKIYLEHLLKGKYSKKFISLLCSMLEIHEKNRPDFIELEKIMKKWK